MAFLNTTCTYAIRAAVYVASATPGAAGYVSTRKIAEDLGVSFAFLTKVLQGLTQSGILLSQRGSSGGVALARPADSITLLDIVASAGRDDVFRDCVLGLPTCSEVDPCALHERWRDERSRLETLFAGTTLAALQRDPALGLASRDLASRDLASRDLASRDLASRDLANAGRASTASRRIPPERKSP